MKIMTSTMGKGLEVFINMMDLLRQRIHIDKMGLYVADSQFFNAFFKKNPLSKHMDIQLLKEWEITGEGKNAKPDWKRIARYEQEIGDPTFWNSLVADRRIFFGKHCKYKQDYVSRFSYEQMMGILDTALIRIDDFIESINPDLILSFGIATFGDYLLYLFARNRNIPYLQLKSSKIDNYVSLNDTAVGLSSHIRNIYLDNKDLPEEIKHQAQIFLDSVVRKGVKYEGAILSGRSRMMKRIKSAPLNILKGLLSGIKIILDPVVRNDTHVPGSFIPSLYYNLFQPVKAISMEKRLTGHTKYYNSKSLRNIGDFIFYPLHFEPEVSLQVFGRPYQNQIELVRNVAQNIPVGMKVLVKEHPRSLGFRASSYYKRLMDIPNVFLIDPFIPAIEIVRYARLVAVVSGTIGFEAAICRKPVVVFGKVGYSILPETMVRQITDLNSLGYVFRDALTNYSYDHAALEKYVGAIMMGSVPVDLYTVLLNKSGRYSDNGKGKSVNDRRLRDYERLTKYCLQRIREALGERFINS
jgi:hypothetical protein